MDRARLTIHDHRHCEQAHETAFGVVHVKAIPEPLLGLAANLTLEALTVASRYQVWCEVVTKVLADRSALGQHDGLRERRCSNSDQRRLAERVNGFELWRR